MHISFLPEKIFHIGNFAITNTLLMAWITMVILITVAFLIYKSKIRLAPTGLQNAAEILIEGALNVVFSVTGDKKQAEKFLPFIITIFIFILLSNWLGVLPGMGSVGFYEIENGEKTFIPFFRSAYSDLNMTLALALISVLAIQAIGIAAIGFRKYRKKFINFENPISFFVGILELISEFSKIISFSFRLFGNIFAGKILLVVIIFLIPFIAPLPFLFLELFVGFVQALVFSMLTLVFLKMAIMHY